jgi:hypothetical protein
MMLMLAAEPPDEQEGFRDNAPAHLRFANAATFEGNGDLDNAYAVQVRAARDLKLEGVSGRMDGREI